MGRAPCCEKVGLKRGRWTAEEDEMLTKYILSNGEGSWRSLPKNAGLLRCGKSCRLRWINYLRADLKRGNISKEEEETIVKLHTSLGNRWSLIAAHLPGRTDNEIKNYWNSHLSRRIYSFRRNAYESSPTTTTAGATTATSPLLNIPKTCITNCSRGRTSRAAMKKQRAALISLRKKEQQQPMPHPNQVIATQITEETDKVAHYNTPTFSTQISGGSGSGSGSTTSSDRNGTQDLELGNINKVDGGSSCDKLNGAEDRDADTCCRKSGDDAGQEDESLGPYEWLDCEIKRLEYILQEGEGEGVLGSGINSIDSLKKEIEVGGGANNGDGRGPIHGGGGGGEIMMERTNEVGIESDWAYIRRSPSPGPGPRIGDEGLDFLFDWDWPAGADGAQHHHSQWEWDLLWGEDDGIGSLSPLNYD